ncbi:hypothetical protein VNO77_13552 [Canavalia gladiata]|uniref:Uncharacterized protein n=1 Tax=Canavalia gladiata TaxID=3824 RepID=A0AAN9LYM7_CANGL
MAQFGYTYESFSTFNTSSVRSEAPGHVAKPFSPFVPKTNGNSEGHVIEKKIVPVVSNNPYGNEANYHARPRDEDGWRNHHQTSPVRGSPREVDNFLTKVMNEPNRPVRSIPVTSPRHSPIGGTIRNDNRDGYNVNNYAYGNKEGRNPIGSTIKNDKYDGYNNGTNGYGGDYGNYGNREVHKPIGNPEKKDFYDGYNGNPKGYGGYGDYNKKEGHNPTGSPIRNGYSNGYGDYGVGNGKPTLNNYDDNDYGDYGNHFNNKERPRPAGSGVGPKSSLGWTLAPRKGTQLSEPTDDIYKAIELLKNEADKRNGYVNNGGPKYDNYDYNGNNERRYDGPGPLISRHGPTASQFDKGMDLVNETERLKKIVTGPQSRPVQNRDGSWSNANLNHSSSRPPFITTSIDGRGADTTRYGVINHREAEKKFQGMTL